ncbi:hypothetical protein [Peribacillus acanthi]|uniref:hypothetical protein n=1 Tax=Peribacillus acanthi TaxID=2171554 RepID=UPI000D3E2870|nr:hypothetical protein [Peribacillus acanthi]
MSSACTCHIDGELCWYCLYENQRQINIKYENTLREISQMQKVRGIGILENKYNKVIDLAQMAMRYK